MLSHENRLIKKTDFRKVQEKGRPMSLKGDNIVLKVLNVNVSGNTRIGFIISKKYSTKATERNKIKRVLREVFKKYLSRIKKNTDIVVSYRKVGKSTRKISQTNLEKQVEKLLIKNKLIKK